MIIIMVGELEAADGCLLNSMVILFVVIGELRIHYIGSGLTQLAQCDR
ncbi:hypothetical protein [Nostoc sp.]